MSLYPMIRVVLRNDRQGYVIAVTEPADKYHRGAELVAGTVSRIDGDGDPRPEWKAWLYPVAGGALHVSQHCDAHTAASPEVLGDLLRKRVDRQGAWWR